MIEFNNPGLQAARLSTRIALRGGGSGRRGAAGKPGGGGVVIKGSYRYHRGAKATGKAGGKLKAHLKYQDGERNHQKADALDEKRHLFDDRGEKINWKEAAEKHENAFIEHRLILSPGDQPTENDLHVHSQATIQRIRQANPQAEVRATYAVHRDTSHPHAHILLTSENRLAINKSDYQDLRFFNNEIKNELQAGREFEPENVSQNLTKIEASPAPQMER